MIEKEVKGGTFMFEINNLQYKNILSIPNLVIDNQITCIIGSSGSGKTTLLRMLNRLSVPDKGVLQYNGINLKDMDSVTLRRKVVMLGQTPIIYPGTIEDNLQIGLSFSQKTPATQDAMEKVLSITELNKSLRDHCATLSGGEKQRLCLARVMLMNGDTYLLDEPSAALDKKTESFIINNLVQFVREYKKELIMVTHSEQVAASFNDSIIRIERGQIKENSNE